MQLNVTYKEIWRIAYPIMLSSLAVSILNITDTVFLGRVGEVELGASVIGGTYYFIILITGMALSNGAQIIMSRRLGENREKEVGTIFDHSIYILIVFSILGFIAVRFLTHAFFPFIIDSEKIYEASILYLDARSYGVFFALITMVFRALCTSIAKTRIITYSMLLMAVTNIILDYVLIFGKFGFEKMGIEGAAIASVIAEALQLVYLSVYVFVKVGRKKYLLFNFPSPDKLTLKRISNISVPIGMQYFISMVSWFLFFVFIEKIGEHQLAISNIVRNAYMLSMTPIWGLSAAASSITSNIIGQGKHKEVFDALRKCCVLSVSLIGMLALVNFIFPEQMLSIFTSDEKLINDSFGCLIVMNIAMLIFSVASVIINTVSGTGATKQALIIESAAITVYIAYIYIVVMVLQLPVEVAWVSEIIYWLILGAMAWVYLRGRKWEKIVV
ncbi:MAG TPA: MATE family efflux transporter [Bacteroidia bacterium]|nr:MATE family efflux transporter [Bacteroidia bacterium]